MFRTMPMAALIDYKITNSARGMCSSVLTTMSLLGEHDARKRQPQRPMAVHAKRCGAARCVSARGSRSGDVPSR